MNVCLRKRCTETQATEAQVAKLQRLIAWLDHRPGRKPLFTL
jgi:hypothetical protein